MVRVQASVFLRFVSDCFPKGAKDSIIISTEVSDRSHVNVGFVDDYWVRGPLRFRVFKCSCIFSQGRKKNILKHKPEPFMRV